MVYHVHNALQKPLHSYIPPFYFTITSLKQEALSSPARHSNLRLYSATPISHILYEMRIDSNLHNLSVASPPPSNLPWGDVPRLRVPQLGM